MLADQSGELHPDSQVYQQDPLADLGESGKGAAHLCLGIVRMGRDDRGVVAHDVTRFLCLAGSTLKDVSVQPWCSSG